MMPLQMRAWYSREQVMLDVVAINFDLDRVDCRRPADGCLGAILELDFEHVNVMFSTGLCARDGQLIFDCDFLEFGKEPLIGWVVFHLGAFKIKTKANFYEFAIWAPDSRVIGNSYAQPELYERLTE